MGSRIPALKSIKVSSVRDKTGHSDQPPHRKEDFRVIPLRSFIEITSPVAQRMGKNVGEVKLFFFTSGNCRILDRAISRQGNGTARYRQGARFARSRDSRKEKRANLT